VWLEEGGCRYNTIVLLSLVQEERTHVCGVCKPGQVQFRTSTHHQPQFLTTKRHRVTTTTP
jgi:hypothetical protein